jgi:hypothetical protein
MWLVFDEALPRCARQKIPEPEQQLLVTGEYHPSNVLLDPVAGLVDRCLGTNASTSDWAAPEALETNMKRSILIICFGLMAATTASAQNPPAQSGPNNNAVNSSGQNNSNAPVAGRNSFTEGQAKSKIEDAGYTNVTELKKDDNGVWRGKASKSGTATAVSVDFQGNVNSAK